MDVYYKKVVLKNFTKFTGKHLCWYVIFNEAGSYITPLMTASVLGSTAQSGTFGRSGSILNLRNINITKSNHII